MTHLHPDVPNEVLTVLNKRMDILEIVDEGTGDRRCIAEQASGSKTTVYRGLSQLEDADLVRARDGHYQLTTVGQALFDRFADLTDFAAILLEQQVFVEALPDDVEPTALTHGRTVQSTEYDPQAACHALREHLADCRTVTAVTPAIRRDLLDSLRDRLVTDALTLDLRTSEEASSALEDGDYEDVLAGDGLSISVVATEPAFGVYLAERTAALTALNDRHQVEAVHITDHDPLVADLRSWVDGARTTRLEGYETSDPI